MGISRIQITSLLVLVGLLTSCGSSVDPVSEPRYASSDEGTKLIAVEGNEEGICILRSSLNDPQRVTLVTKGGALSDKQLEKALRFMAYDKQIASAATVLFFLMWGIADAKTAVRMGDEVGLFLASVVVFTAIGGGMAYRIFEGNKEGEKAAPIAVQSILHGVIFSPIIEYFQRDGRLRKVLSDKETWAVTDKKMVKMIKRIARIEPAYPGQCDDHPHRFF